MGSTNPMHFTDRGDAFNRKYNVQKGSDAGMGVSGGKTNNYMTGKNPTSSSAS